MDLMALLSVAPDVIDPVRGVGMYRQGASLTAQIDHKSGPSRFLMPQKAFKVPKQPYKVPEGIIRFLEVL